MKKSVFCLIIIFLFSCFVFWVGFTQRKIKPQSFGVLQSKTGGLYEKPLLPGQFNWNKEFLLPTNAKLSIFQIEPYYSNKSISGELPSGSLYSKIYNSDYNFAYNFEFDIALTISPNAVVNLIKLNQVNTQEDLQKYLSSASTVVSQLACEYLLTKLQNNSNFKVESLRKDELLKNIKIYTEFPDVEVISISIINSKVPDYSLYSKLQNNYLTQSNINQLDNNQTDEQLKEENNSTNNEQQKQQNINQTKNKKENLTEKGTL